MRGSCFLLRWSGNCFLFMEHEILLTISLSLFCRPHRHTRFLWGSIYPSALCFLTKVLLPEASPSPYYTFRTSYFLLFYHYVPPERRYLPSSPHGITTQKTNLGIFTAVRTSSLLSICSYSSVTHTVIRAQSACYRLLIQRVDQYGRIFCAWHNTERSLCNGTQCWHFAGTPPGSEFSRRPFCFRNHRLSKSCACR